MKSKLCGCYTLVAGRNNVRERNRSEEQTIRIEVTPRWSSRIVAGQNDWNVKGRWVVRFLGRAPFGCPSFLIATIFWRVVRCSWFMGGVDRAEGVMDGVRRNNSAPLSHVGSF